MKKTIGWMSGLAVLVVALGAPVSAHCGHCGVGDDKDKAGMHEKMQDKHLERLTEELKLTADQQSQVKALLVEKQKSMETLREGTHEKIKAILTDEQKGKFDEMKAKGPGKSCPMGCDCPMCSKEGHKHGKSKDKKK